MADTNRLILPLLSAAQAQKHVTMNEALKLLDAIVQAGVIDKDLTAPPGGESEGDIYIVGSSATGSWATHDDDLAIYQDGAYTFVTPLDGFIAFVADETTLYVYNSGWTSLAGLLGAGYLPLGGGTLIGNLVLEETTPSIRFNDTDLTGYTLLQTIGAVMQLAVDAEDDDASSSFDITIDGAGQVFRVNEHGVGVGGASADASNQLAVFGTAALFNSSGSFTFKFNKNAAANDAALSFQTGSSSKALLGLLGNDDFTLKTGATFEEAMVIREKSGRAIFKKIQEGPTPWNVVHRNYVADASWLSSTSAADNNWLGICWSPELGLFCAVADSGTGNRVMTSPDGITWTTRTSAADNSWRSVCWSPELGLFCAVSNSGTGNRVMTSPDGITWTTRTSAADNSWRSVCWSPELGLFCAVSNSGTGNRVMTSPDGITWTTRTSAADNSWLGICWSPELGLFCAVADSGTGNRVMTSPDGITWTTRTSAADNSWRSVCWSPELGLFCAVAYSGTGNRVMTSPDGITWTTRTSAADNSWRSVCWSPELGLFCAVADSGTGNRVMTSPDGITWTTRTSAANNLWLGICWSPELGLFCAVAYNGTGNRVMTSVSAYSFNYRS
jgi:hypothetical protein